MTPRILFLLPAFLAGCAQLPSLDGLRGPFGQAPETQETIGEPEPLPGDGGTSTALPTGASISADSLDTVSEAEKDAARVSAASAPGGTLGEVTVALGDPTDAGLWVKSALVSSDQAGTVRTGSGDAIAVTLRPLGAGAGGPQISLSALQALGLPLTGLHPVTLATGT
ncbi:hypothetical protein [Jannaschia sp. 2305UL9-9]|uniref:hypothetical protein n=1 Tax=Jannaschia sp. 2305UL9-9 TaxID=3121638 RepID=UPI003529A158